jgi:hypothetical protein
VPDTAASDEYGIQGQGNGVCPTCGEPWTASPVNVGPRPPGLECADRWHIDSYPEGDNA